MAGIFNSAVFNNAIFNTGTAAPVVAAAVVTAGVGRKAKQPLIRVRLSEVENRADTAEFLKSQLKIRHPDSAFVSAPPAAPLQQRASENARLARLARQAQETLEAMRIEAEGEERRIVGETNNAILTLILLSNL